MDPVRDELPEPIAAALQALDARAARAAARLNADRVAARVVERLRREGTAEPRRAWWMTPAVLRVAAALVILVGAGATAARMLDHGSTTAAVRLPVAIPVDSLSTQQLEAVLRAVGEVRAANFAPVTSSNPSLDSLSEQELQKLLASLSDAEG